MARADGNVTTNLGLPLRTTGSVQLGFSFRKAMVMIDTAIANIQAGVGLRAEEIAYDSGNPGDSNSGATTVAGALDDIYAQLNVLNAKTDSNSAG